MLAVAVEAVVVSDAEVLELLLEPA